LITVGGNPVSSNPNSRRLDAAIGSLEFVVSIDPYINETTRHADVILPPPSALQKSHYDLALLNFAVRNVANYSPAVLPLGDGQLNEWEIVVRLAGLLFGLGSDPDIAAIDDQVVATLVDTAVRDEYSNVAGRQPSELHEALGERHGPERLLDLLLRSGPYGDGFGAAPGGLTLAELEANPHGVDLGPLEPDRIPDLLRTPSGKIEAYPDPVASDVPRLLASLDRDWGQSMVLVGRRHVRSNNSWMHNVRVLTKGRNRCTLQVHPDDADRLGLVDGSPATVRSRVGEVAIDVEVTDGIRPGVVSIPHGFGQNLPGVRQRVAQEYRGVNTNELTDELFYDAISGNIALNGVPVTVEPATA
jgi:anaerobic selenocysteine-containing dehydrogenase